MTLTRCLYIGFGLIMFWVVVMGTLNGTQALLSIDEESRLDDSLVQIGAAN